MAQSLLTVLLPRPFVAQPFLAGRSSVTTTQPTHDVNLNEASPYLQLVLEGTQLPTHLPATLFPTSVPTSSTSSSLCPYLLNSPNPILTCIVLIPGFGCVIPAFDMCINRTSAVKLCLSPKKCAPNAPAVVKLICEVPSGTFVFVNNVPPSISKYGFTFRGFVKIHLNANGLIPPPYAVFVFCVITHTGTTSSAYSSCPFKNPGPFGEVITIPYRSPRFQTPVPEVLPLIPCPPPVHTCHSLLAPSGPACACAQATGTDIINKIRIRHFSSDFTESAPKIVSAQYRKHPALTIAIIFLNASACSVAQLPSAVCSLPSSFLAPVFVPALLLRPCTLVHILRHAVVAQPFRAVLCFPPPLCTTRVAIETEGPPRCRDRLLRRSARVWLS